MKNIKSIYKNINTNYVVLNRALLTYTSTST